jgi:hypothetical protein
MWNNDTAQRYWRIFQQLRMIVWYDSYVTEGKCGMQMCVPKGSKNFLVEVEQTACKKGEMTIKLEWDVE